MHAAVAAVFWPPTVTGHEPAAPVDRECDASGTGSAVLRSKDKMDRSVRFSFRDDVTLMF